MELAKVAKKEIFILIDSLIMMVLKCTNKRDSNTYQKVTRLDSEQITKVPGKE